MKFIHTYWTLHCNTLIVKGLALARIYSGTMWPDMHQNRGFLHTALYVCCCESRTRVEDVLLKISTRVTTPIYQQHWNACVVIPWQSIIRIWFAIFQIFPLNLAIYPIAMGWHHKQNDASVSNHINLYIYTLTLLYFIIRRWTTTKSQKKQLAFSPKMSCNQSFCLRTAILCAI